MTTAHNDNTADVVEIDVNKLETVNEIGRGSYGRVYKMIWKKEEGAIQVAAKQLNQINNHEVDVLSKLKHPNIVKLLAIATAQFVFMLIMELCEGGSLRSYLVQHTHEHIPLFYDWARQAITAIEYLQEMKIVHKDIKSSNFFIALTSNTMILKLGDFGLAKEVGETMSKATGRGTWAWMAPELLKYSILSQKFDIYAFAIVLWEMWTRGIPFEGLEYQTIVWKVCTEKERPIIPGDCPEALAQLMRECWQEDWTKRPKVAYILSVLAGCQIGHWGLERHFGHQDEPGQLYFARGVAMFANGDIAVADGKTAQVKVYDGRGSFKISIDTTHGVNPGQESLTGRVAVGLNDTIFVTDETQYVKVYEADGKYERHFAVVSPQNTPSDAENTRLVGLKIDNKGDLMVGEANQKYISKHAQDGTHLGSCRVSIRPVYLAVTSNDAIVIGDYDVNTVQIIDQTGQILQTLNAPTGVTSWCPRGICCNKDIIYVSNNSISKYKLHNPHDDRGIYCYSVSGDYIGCVTKEATKPHGLIARGGNELIVAEWDLGVKVFRRK